MYPLLMEKDTGEIQCNTNTSEPAKKLFRSQSGANSAPKSKLF